MCDKAFQTLSLPSSFEEHYLSLIPQPHIRIHNTALMMLTFPSRHLSNFFFK